MNVVILIGRLTRNPELKYIPGTGAPVTTFSLAVNRPFSNKEGKKEADFFNVVVWGKQAEHCANYLEKGRLVAIRGSIRNRSYESEGEEKRYFTEISADNVEFLGGKNEVSKDQEEKVFEPKGLDTDGFEALDDDDIPF